MTSAGPKTNSEFVGGPHNVHPVVLGSMPQVPVYQHNPPQVYLYPGNQPGLARPVFAQPAQTAFKEGKVLGAVQILIGLIHIGVGSIIGTVLGHYMSVAVYGGYPFWGGILEFYPSWLFMSMRDIMSYLVLGRFGSLQVIGFWFIISGSLSVSSEQQPESVCLLKGSLGLNIVSAIFSAFGIILFATDIGISPFLYYEYYPDWGVAPVLASSAVLFIFSLLEFSIACTLSHFGCQPVCCSQNNGAVVFPNVFVTRSAVNPVPVNPPPTYSNEVHGSQ